MDSITHGLCGLTCEALSRALIERLAYGDQPLLLRGPVAAAGNGAVDHQIVAVDEAGLIAGEKQRGIRDVIGEAGALNRLRGLVHLAHHVGGLFRGLGRQAERLADDTGSDRTRAKSN